MKKKFFVISILILLLIIISFVFAFIYNLSPVDSKSDKIVLFTIEKGSTKNSIINNLKKKNLIRSELFSKIVVKLRNKELYAGTYRLSKDLSTNEILKMIEEQKNMENENVSITFVEGKRLSTYVKQISENFNYSEEEINNVLNDEKFLNSLVLKYWFITESIFNEDIYVNLEGYLFPDTYEFKKNSTIEDIIYRLLDNMEDKLNNYKEEIELSDYNIHELLTLASIVELEGVNSKDRAMVAGVLYNRLNSNMTLGSDVTTYYAVNKDFTSDLTYSDLNSCNGYNTRGTCVTGLPVGPICSPSLSSIAAVIEPKDNKYYYFVADNEKNTYFSETISEHEQIVQKLKNEGKWFNY